MARVQTTKNIIMGSFMELLEEKPFNEITISDITDRCELSRLTFYYHFRDKYDVLNRTLDLMIMYPLKQGLSRENWTEHLKYAFETIKAHEIYSYHALLFDNGEFQNHIIEVMSRLFREFFEGTAESRMAEEDVEFMCKFFSYGVAGSILDWIKRGMEESPEKLAEKIESLVENRKNIIIEDFLSEENIRNESK